MAIEGPLRELGIHDVFQLLDLSRKTGALRVTSALRDNHGVVYFDGGRVIAASIRSNPHPLGQLLLRSGKVTEGELSRARAMQRDRGDPRRLGEILLDLGAITQRELERQVRLQVETVVFELMSWSEGFFSFEECGVGDVPADATVRISMESLLMEGARRIDEWSRIVDKVPNLDVIPVLAPVNDDHPSLLDLLPNEWEVLAVIDGSRDLRGIAASLARSEFDIAKIAYGLVSTGVIELRHPERLDSVGPVESPRPHIGHARAALADRHFEDALAAARRGIAADPGSAEARLVAALALRGLGRAGDAAEELRRAAQADPSNAEVQLELGYAAACKGDLAGAIGSWQRFLSGANGGIHAQRARTAVELAERLRELLEAHAGV